jgi:hypothetical protein
MPYSDGIKSRNSSLLNIQQSSIISSVLALSVSFRTLLSKILRPCSSALRSTECHTSQNYRKN